MTKENQFTKCMKKNEVFREQLSFESKTAPYLAKFLCLKEASEIIK